MPPNLNLSFVQYVYTWFRRLHSHSNFIQSSLKLSIIFYSLEFIPINMEFICNAHKFQSIQAQLLCIFSFWSERVFVHCAYLIKWINVSIAWSLGLSVFVGWLFVFCSYIRSVCVDINKYGNNSIHIYDWCDTLSLCVCMFLCYRETSLSYQFVIFRQTNRSSSHKIKQPLNHTLAHSSTDIFFIH